MPEPTKRLRLGVRASRWGIVAALGAVTIALPVIGVQGLIEPVGMAQAVSAGMPRAASLLPAVPFVAIASDPAPTGEVPVQAVSPIAAPSTPEALAATRARAEQAGVNQSHAAMPGCVNQVVETTADNGRLNPAYLCIVPWATGQEGMATERRLRPDAALALARLNAAYVTEFGTDLCVGDTYRSYEEQASAKARKPGLAAAPGASNHGWALAADLCGGIQDDTSPQWAWMAQNAPAYGWNNPDWARADGRGPHEPWHWEFAAAVKEKKAAAASAPSSGSTKAGAGNAGAGKAGSTKAGAGKAGAGKASSGHGRSR